MARGGSDKDRLRIPAHGNADTAPATLPPASADPANELASRGERYRLGAELGRGGMGRVVEAYDTQLGRTVALKEILPRAGTNLTRRFAREVHLTARLEHPSIVPLYDAGVTIDGRPYYVMRRVSGRPFDELIANAKDLGARLTLLPELLAAIDAIAHAHRRGVIHRDLKPGNILVGELGETVVIDWGLAKAIGESDAPPDDDDEAPAPLAGDSLQTQIGAVFGTPGFMAPEQARGEELDAGGDVYALGACLYQLLAGTAPLAGKSATEVIEKTHRHDIVPLAQRAPGAPPELAAIVEKAMSFDAARRYPHAGALAEDVRRFLDGRLVAAHQYTKRQRIARFARRHRAPLGVAALALAAVAVLAWVSVRRIVRERDVAREAREIAISSQREAETARDRERDRSDALLVTQARSLLGTNPTEAVALLKQLSPGSPHLVHARAIAQSAALRGVAWAMEGPPDRGVPFLDIGGTYLAIQARRGGAVHVYDLVKRSLVRSRTFPEPVRVNWVAKHQLFVASKNHAPKLYDPATDAVVELASQASDFEISDDGRRVLVHTAGEHGVALVDVERRTATRLATDRSIAQFALAPDGSWLALHDGAHVVVLDTATHAEILRHATTKTVFFRPARAKRLAFFEDGRDLFECNFEASAACTQIPLPPNARLLEMRYLGRELLVRFGAELAAWNGFRLRYLPTRTATSPLFDAGDHLVFAAEGGKLHFFAPYGEGTLLVPSTPLNAKLATRHGAPRVVVVGDNTSSIVVFELANVEPVFISTARLPRATFADDATLLLHDTSDNRQWRWLDVATRTLTPFEDTGALASALVDLDTRGHAIVRAATPSGLQLQRVRRGQRFEVALAYHGNNPMAGWGFSAAGDALVLTAGDTRVHGKLGDAPVRELFAFEGNVIDTAVIGPMRIAALSSKGELVRGNIETNQYERRRLAGATAIGRDIAGRVLVAVGGKLFAWEQDVVELADLKEPIALIQPVEGGAAVVLRDYATIFVESGPTKATHRVLEATSKPPIFSRDGRLAIGMTALGELTVVELPSRASWRVPSFSDSIMPLPYAVAPSSRAIAELVPGGIALRSLPDAGSDIHAYLSLLTNATVDESHALVWPWQAKQPSQP